MLNRSKTKRSVFIECREWHDKTYGNTYYSARVFVDGVHLYSTGTRYGYGDQHKHDITTELVARGYLPAGMIGRSLSFARDAGLDIYTTRSSVNRRDLWPAEDNQAEIEQARLEYARLRHAN